MGSTKGEPNSRGASNPKNQHHQNVHITNRFSVIFYQMRLGTFKAVDHRQIQCALSQNPKNIPLKDGKDDTAFIWKHETTDSQSYLEA